MEAPRGADAWRVDLEAAVSRSAPCPAWLHLRHRCELPASHGGDHRAGSQTWPRTPAEQRLFERTVLGHVPVAPARPAR